jgi:outer membrane receptor for ferrienterochelin and colicins
MRSVSPRGISICTAFVIMVIMMTPLSVSAQADMAVAAPVGYSEESILFQDIPSVIGASKYEQKVTEAPSSVSIVTASDIKKFGYRTLADILKSVRSFYITNDRNYSYIGVRGFGRPGDYNSRILLLIDGHRTNDNLYNQAFVGTEGLIDVDLIDRVEVIRGPGSSLYGSNAFFAVINVITKRGRDLKGMEVSGEAGSYTTYKERLTYGDKYGNGLEAILSGTGYSSNGQQLYFPEFDPSNPNADPDHPWRPSYGGYAAHADYDRSKTFFTKASYQDFTVEGAYSERVKGIPTAAFGTDFNNPGNKTTDGHAYLDVKYEHSMSARTDIEARVFADYAWYRGDYSYITDPLYNALNKDFGYGNWAGAEVKVSTRLYDVHRLIAGAEYTGNMRQDQRTYDVDPYFLYLDDERRSRDWAFYLQDEISLSKKMVLNLGVRYDHYSEFGGTTNPRLAFIYNPTDKSAIKMLYGSAFRKPNDYELYYSIPGLNLANPELKPEKIKTFEAVYEHYLGEGFLVSLSGYYYGIKDLIEQIDTGFGAMYENAGEIRAKGAELEFDNKWSNGGEGRLSYSIQRTESTATGEPLDNAPAQLAKLNLSVPLLGDKMFCGIEEQYMTRRRTDSGNYTQAFYFTNLTLSLRNLPSRVEASVSVYNLMNKKYADPVSFADLNPLDSVQQDGRTWRVKLTYAF